MSYYFIQTQTENFFILQLHLQSEAHGMDHYVLVSFFFFKFSHIY